MRAAVTQAQRRMTVVDVAEPEAVAPGEVLVRPETVGICGSDFHYFVGDLGEDPRDLYPRIQGHEFSALVADIGPECPAGLARGQRVAVWPVRACGACYACRAGRGNACERISLIGIHTDGALQELLRVPADQVFPVDLTDSRLAAFVEPMSIAVRAVNRGRVAAGEQVAVLGAGPIGQSLALAAADRGASVLLVDRVESRLELGRGTGAAVAQIEAGEDSAAAIRAWSGEDGPDVVFEATGSTDATRAAIAAVAQAGRVVIVGLSGHDMPVGIGQLAFRELDVLGTSCCSAEEFAAAADLVARRVDAIAPLVTHEFGLEEAPEAIAYAMAHPAEVLKAVVHVGPR